DEVAGAGLRGELEPLAPAHARLAPHHIDHALERAMMMRSGLRVRLDRDRAGPELLGTCAREIDRGLAVHAGRLRRVRVERMARDHPHAIVLPFRLGHRVPRRWGSEIGPQRWNIYAAFTKRSIAPHRILTWASPHSRCRSDALPHGRFAHGRFAPRKDQTCAQTFPARTISATPGRKSRN